MVFRENPKFSPPTPPHTSLSGLAHLGSVVPFFDFGTAHRMTYLGFGILSYVF